MGVFVMLKISNIFLYLVVDSNCKLIHFHDINNDHLLKPPNFSKLPQSSRKMLMIESSNSLTALMPVIRAWCKYSSSKMTLCCVYHTLIFVHIL